MDYLNERYKVEKKLSEKGTFFSTDRITGKKVILKNSTLFESTGFEYEILKEINNEFMPVLTDGFYHEGDFYFVENFIDGVPLDKYMEDKNNLTFDEILGISIMIGRLIGFLHKFKKPIVHGDINPKNILINKRKNIFLIDFSSSIFLEYVLYKDFHVEGTFGFFSPEQILANKNLGLFSDIYGLGALISYMINKSGNNMALELAAIAGKAMEIKPEKRFKSIEELISTLEYI